MNKTYVITGSTSGIGKEILLELSKNKNNKIFAAYRNDKFIKELGDLSDNVIPFYIDMNDNKSIIKASEIIKSQTNKIDTIINIAGCVVAGAMENLDIDKIRYQFEVNTFSHLMFTQNLIEKADNGKIINISSMASFGIFPFVAPYCASKRALDILFNCLEVESKQNIKVISIKPGVIATPLWEKSITNNCNLTNDIKYKKEFDFLINNAQKNSTKGLDVKKVRDLVLRTDKCKNPKKSYTIGFDAKIAEFLSILPQDIITYLMKKGLELKLKNQSFAK